MLPTPMVGEREIPTQGDAGLRRYAERRVDALEGDSCAVCGLVE